MYSHSIPTTWETDSKLPDLEISFSAVQPVPPAGMGSAWLGILAFMCTWPKSMNTDNLQSATERLFSISNECGFGGRRFLGQ